VKHRWIVDLRQRCDLELLLVGGFKPLSGFQTKLDYESILKNLRLANGQVWPIPITLDVSAEFAEKVQIADELELCDADNTILARMTVTDKWKPDKIFEAKQVFGTTDTQHPGVNYLLNRAKEWYLGGPIDPVQLPKHYDFTELRKTPDVLKQDFSKLGLKNIIGFQTRNPLHRAHIELTLRAAKQIDGHILIHPVVGMTKPNDVDYFTRVRCYHKALQYYPEKTAFLSLLPLAMRMGGPREALWHALIRKNYGCTHFIVGRDHAGPGNDSNQQPFYEPYAAQTLAEQYSQEIGVQIIPFQEMTYVKERKLYCPINELKPNETPLTVSGTQLRQLLHKNKPIPKWFSYPDIVKELKRSYPSRHQQGFTLFFTGLSGAGKTTLANALISKLRMLDRRSVTLLDGDILRRILSTELGFSKKDRDLNIQRIGYVASEVTKSGGIAVCAAIAPYLKVREENRQLISEYGGYVELYISTPLATCAKRDTKGLYAKAKKGEITGLTGYDDPYEPPLKPEIIIDTTESTIENSLNTILCFLQSAGYLKT